MRLFLAAVGYLVGSFLILIGLLFSFASILGGAAMLLAGAICLPPVWRAVQARFRKTLPFKLRLGLVAVLCVVSVTIGAASVPDETTLRVRPRVTTPPPVGAVDHDSPTEEERLLQLAADTTRGSLRLSHIWADLAEVRPDVERYRVKASYSAERARFSGIEAEIRRQAEARMFNGEDLKIRAEPRAVRATWRSTDPCGETITWGDVRADVTGLLIGVHRGLEHSDLIVTPTIHLSVRCPDKGVLTAQVDAGSYDLWRQGRIPDHELLIRE